MQTALDNVLALLDLEAIEVNLFRGRSPDDDRQRIFGGQVAGQALVAASRTVDTTERPRNVHSLHAYFLRPGDPKRPVLYEVDRIRDGRSFTTRRVVAIQHGRAIFQLAASFHVDEPGHEHLAEMPDVPDPETLAPRRFAQGTNDNPTGSQPSTSDTATKQSARRSDLKAHMALLTDLPDRLKALDFRYVTASSPVERTGPLPPHQRVWMRANGTLGDDPVLHSCLLTYASDMTLLDTTLLPHGKSFMAGDVMLASLDHAMWFHGPFRADDWLLYDQYTPAATGGRGLATGRVFTRDGRLVASVVQEGLIRPVTR